MTAFSEMKFAFGFLGINHFLDVTKLEVVPKNWTTN